LGTASGPLYASVVLDGQRRAALVEQMRVRVDPHLTLEKVVSTGARIDLGAAADLTLDEVELVTPLRPPFLLCCGQNYRSHLDEQSVTPPTEPEFFIKAGVTIAPPFAPHVLRRDHTTKLDYETELGVVLGQDARDVVREDAPDYIFGYVVINDLSARDRQLRRRGRSSTGSGKNFDGATRLASMVVPTASVRDPQDLWLTTRVNGELRQSESTRNMLFSCSELVAAFSRSFTIPAGTIIATGTPGGTGLGCDETLGGTGATPPGCERARYLREGDLVVSDIEDIGSLSFEVTGHD
jgi:2-keto-4-pentenoate hydratase/2-oxohepta-3-ene-1,7-dioic acid hydratase in catechol pathway